MSWTRDYRENKPLGGEDANLADDYLRYILVDIAERLEAMFYGFNKDDASNAEAKYGVKFLKFYKEDSDPTAETDYGHFYVKLVSGLPELFWQDDTNGTRQLTNGGKLNVIAGDYTADSIDEDDIELDNDSYLTAANDAGSGTVNLIKAGSNDLATLPDSAEMASNAAPVEDEAIANKKYVDDQVQSSQAVGTSDISNTSGDWQNVADMSITTTTKGGNVLLLFSARVSTGGNGEIGQWRFSVDGSSRHLVVSYYETQTLSFQWLETSLEAGSHAFKVQWKDYNGTVSQNGTLQPRVFTAIELPS